MTKSKWMKGQLASVFKKKYEGINCAAKTFKEAIQEEADKYRSCSENSLITDWIDKQREAYMGKEWDEEWKECGANYCDHCHRGVKEDDNDKRAEWADQRAWDDFNDMWADCKTDEDCYNMGFDVKIEGYENQDGIIIPPEEVMEICPYCGDEIWSKNNLPKENDEGELYCDNCGHEIDGEDINSELRLLCPILILKKM